MTRLKLAKEPAGSALTAMPAYRWIVLTIAWLALLFAFVDRLAWANVSIKVGGALGLPLGSLGMFVTAFYVGYVIANALGGLGTDRFGPSRMLAFALIPLGLSTFAFSYTTSTLMGLAIQAVMGLAAGADYSACVKLTATWFDFKMRGRAMGLLTTASSVAVVATNAIVPSLTAIIGWTGVYQILGALTAGVGVLCLTVLRDAEIPRAPSATSPSLEVLAHNKDLALLALIGFGALWGTWGFAFWVNALIVKGHGLSGATAGIIAAMFGVGAIFSKPLVGLVSDLLGGKRKPILIVCFASFTAMLLCIRHAQKRNGVHDNGSYPRRDGVYLHTAYRRDGRRDRRACSSRLSIRFYQCLLATRKRHCSSSRGCSVPANQLIPYGLRHAGGGSSPRNHRHVLGQRATPVLTGNFTSPQRRTTEVKKGKRFSFRGLLPDLLKTFTFVLLY